MDSIVSGFIEFLTRHAAGLSAPILGGLMGFMAHLIVFRLAGSWPTGARFSRYCRRPLAWTLPVAGAAVALSASPVAGPGWDAVGHLLLVALVLGMAWVSVGLIQVATTAYLGRFDTGVTDNLEARKVHTQMEIVRKIAVVVVTILAVSAVFMSFEDLRELGTGILASAGVVGLIVGLAAQRTLGNVLAGFQIAITQPIRLDDVVIVEGEWGWIEEITLTYVVVRIWDQRRLVVPISHFIEKPFQNWTRTSAAILGTVYLYLDHTIPVEDVREEVGRLVEANEHWDGRVWRLDVTDTTEKTVELRALMSAATSPSAWDLRCAVREGLLEWVRRNHPDTLPRFRAEIRHVDGRGGPDGPDKASGQGKPSGPGEASGPGKASGPGEASGPGKASRPGKPGSPGEIDDPERVDGGGTVAA